MEQKDIERAIRYVLRYALEHDGIAGYNPCMYYLGFADNIHPSESFNNELRKYGSLKYSNRYVDIDEYYNDYSFGTWSYFQIDERGRKYMEETEPSKFSQVVRIILSICLTIIQIPFVIEGWGSFFLNLFVKFLSSIFSPIALVSFVWWPLDMFCAICWVGCDWLRHKVWDKRFTLQASSRRWFNHFPQL